MEFVYNGYVLQIEQVIKDGALVDYKGYCKELGNFTISGMNGYTNMINRFKTEVDLKAGSIESFRQQAAYFEELAVENGNSGENDWDLVNNRYPQLVEELISALEASIKRERELLADVEKLQRHIPQPESDREGIQDWDAGESRYNDFVKEQWEKQSDTNQLVLNRWDNSECANTQRITLENPDIDKLIELNLYQYLECAVLIDSQEQADYLSEILNIEMDWMKYDYYLDLVEKEE